MRENLGEFEQLMLLAIMQLDGPDDDVYGIRIVDEIERRAGRRVSPAAVYITLRRLETKGLLASRMSAPTGEPGGKARRCVRVTKAGVTALRGARQTIDRMWQGIDLRARSGK
ncbi:MAG: PadR family transcriptional regulator [Acidobacteriota bacterium]|nr:PadR family transcriptional regulator [Acidobacteriota bacterium]